MDLFAPSDDEFFGKLQSKSSNLQHLFKEDGLPKDEKQQSLKYERPKATDLKKTDTNDETASSSSKPRTNNMSSTLMAKVVTAYKQGELQGKLGLALIKNTDESFNLLMYKSKTHILVMVKLGNDDSVLFKQQQFWQFYDQQNVYWSWRFETMQDEDDFRDILLKNGQSFKESEDQQNGKVAEQKQQDNIPNLDVTKSKGGTKNALIERMAKMGQPLPNLATISQESNKLRNRENSDSSVSSNSSSHSPVVIRRSFPPKYANKPKTGELTTVDGPQQLVTSTVALNSSIFPVNAMESQYMQMMLTEQRTQGSELRMNMNKLETKIEKVLDKIDLIDRVATTEPKEKRHRDDEILELEEKILNLKKENRKLKQQLEQDNEQDLYVDKSKQLLNEYRDVLKDINMGHIKDLSTLIKCCIENIQENKKELKERIEKQQELEKESKDKQKDLETLSSSSNQLNQQLKDYKEQQLVMTSKLEVKEKMISDYEQQIVDLNTQIKDKMGEKSQQPPSDVIVKSVMNNLYADIREKLLLQYSNLENSEQILNLVATSIKQETLKSLQQKQSENK